MFVIISGQVRVGNTGMGWEKRQSGAAYYTRSHRVNGRVTREYVGGGLIGELAAEMDANARRDREAKMAAWRAEKAEIESREKRLSEFSDHVETLARSALLSAGFHRHHRGEWRKKR